MSLVLLVPTVHLDLPELRDLMAEMEIRATLDQGEQLAPQDHLATARAARCLPLLPNTGEKWLTGKQIMDLWRTLPPPAGIFHLSLRN